MQQGKFQPPKVVIDKDQDEKDEIINKLLGNAKNINSKTLPSKLIIIILKFSLF